MDPIQKTRKYLWTQMKYQDESSNPISVSIFVEKGDGGKAYFQYKFRN